MKYNAAGYNEQRYNINGTVHASNFSESLAPTEATDIFDVYKALAEAITANEATIVFSVEPFLADVIFVEDAIRVDFTNKALFDTVRMADWLSVRRYPFVNEWSN